MGMLEGAESAGVSKHGPLDGHGGSPGSGGDCSAGLCAHTRPVRLALFLSAGRNFVVPARVCVT